MCYTVNCIQAPETMKWQTLKYSRVIQLICITLDSKRLFSLLLSDVYRYDLILLNKCMFTLQTQTNVLYSLKIIINKSWLSCVTDYKLSPVICYKCYNNNIIFIYISVKSLLTGSK